jgi:hypothetical protein
MGLKASSIAIAEIRARLGLINNQKKIKATSISRK